MMNKYLKYGWLAIVVIIPVFLNFSKTEQDIFTVVSSSALDGVKEEIEKSPKLINTADKNGFTMYDYAVLNNDKDVQRWMISQKISSGVSPQMIERVRLWFLLLGVPVNSKNFNLQGIYDKGLEEAILNYQATRGLSPQKQITPDWYADLEEDGVRFLQELLFDEGSEKITGVWDESSTNALKAFQASEGLPETGHLSLADIVALRKAYSNTIAQREVAVVEEVIEPAKTSSTQPEVKLVEDMEVSIPATVIEPVKPVEVEEVKAEPEDDAKAEESAKPEAMTAGFLIDSNATAGKLLNLQVWLTLAGFPAGTLDGQMGPSTRQAIKDFETSIGLKPTGIMSAKWEVPLEKQIWKKVQQKLKQLELYDQEIDGIPGASTVDALKSYEEVSGIKPNGSLLPETLSMLFNEGQMTSDGSMEETVLTEADHAEEDGIIEEEGDDEAGEGVITEGSEGTKPEEEPVVEIAGSVSSFNPNQGVEDTVQLQLMLAVLGYFKDEVDGKPSDELTAAIKAYQSSNGLGADGKVGRQTMAKMNSQTITRVQRYLNEKGLLDDAPTGTLGPKTRKIVMDLRKQHKLPEADPTQLDIGILLVVLGDVNNENYVKTYLDMLEQQRILKEKTQSAQEYMTALGYFNGKIDGLQGKATNDAIEKFKKENKLPVNADLTDNFFKAMDKEIIKQIQQGLGKLGYKIKADGMTGPTTKKTIETFQKRYSHKVTGMPDLATLHQVNERIALNSRRAPVATSATVVKNNTANSVANDQPIRGVMPTMGAKGAQNDTILTSPPKAISGRMSMIYNSKGALAGCKVNNISISAAMCGSAKNNQQCRIVYRKGRVLSVSCRG